MRRTSQSQSNAAHLSLPKLQGGCGESQPGGCSEEGAFSLQLQASVCEALTSSRFITLQIRQCFQEVSINAMTASAFWVPGAKLLTRGNFPQNLTKEQFTVLNVSCTIRKTERCRRKPLSQARDGVRLVEYLPGLPQA